MVVRISCARLPSGVRLYPAKNSTAGAVVHLSDVARVEIGPDERRGLTELNGQGEVVGGIVLQRDGENALAVIKNVKQKIAEIADGLPKAAGIDAGAQAGGHFVAVHVLVIVLAGRGHVRHDGRMHGFDFDAVDVVRTALAARVFDADDVVAGALRREDERGRRLELL